MLSVAVQLAETTTHSFAANPNMWLSPAPQPLPPQKYSRWDNNNRQIVKEELAARVYAVHKKTMKDPDLFEPNLWGRNAGEYWKPKILGFIKGLFILCTMFAVNYGRAYYARAWNCHWPTITNLGGILDTPFCAGLKWVDSIWNGLQQSFVYGGAAAVAYAIPTMLGWRGEPTRQIY